MQAAKHIKRRLRKAVLSVVLLAAAFVFLFPLILTVTNSFMSEQEIESSYSRVISSNPESGKHLVRQICPCKADTRHGDLVTVLYGAYKEDTVPN